MDNVKVKCDCFDGMEWVRHIFTYHGESDRNIPQKFIGECANEILKRFEYNKIVEANIFYSNRYFGYFVYEDGYWKFETSDKKIYESHVYLN